MRLTKDNLPERLRHINDYSAKNTSYSPFFSNIGLEIGSTESGIGGFWLHINRFSRLLWDVFADFDAEFLPDASAPWKLVFKNGANKAELAFYGTDTFLLSLKDISDTKLLAVPDKDMTKYREETSADGIVLISGYSKNGDARDPDEAMPFTLGIRTIKGTAEINDGVRVIPAEDGEALLAFAFEALETDDDRITEKLYSAPATVVEAAEKCLTSIEDCAKDLDFECTEEEADMTAKAINGLIANISLAPGRLKRHLSAYPSRGYSSHFMWDTCFQNLAYEDLSPALAKDFLLQFAACQRDDGKYAQFLCATWERPSYSQPPLAGWAALRLMQKSADAEFIDVMLPSLIANTKWWLTNRMTRFGLICCPHGLETGQDDSPRFDHGTTVSCDMNSYLLNQMCCIAELAKMRGKNDLAAYWHKKADVYAEKMTKVLYCAEDNIFYDVDPTDGSFVKIVSPVSFLPFWAGIRLDGDLTEKSIKNYLVNKEYLFCDIPFPSVAYNEPSYQHEKWWRGPTWLPNAWLMLETLGKCGFVKERNEAAQKLHDMVMKDKEMHELFDSATGEGLGCKEQGWTCAVFMALCDLLRGKYD